MPEKLTRAKIVAALQALGEDLSGRGVHGQVFVVGGAVMALAYSDRRVTRDINAVFEPKAVIYKAARKVAETLDLPADWLNNAARSFMPGHDEDPRPIPEVKGIEIATASPRYLLAMKLMATRIGEDDEDIRILLRECKITRPEEALALLASLYPTREPSSKARLFLERLLD